jgi:hypothetical protein
LKKAAREDVVRFLTEIKKLVSAKRLYVIPRIKNRECLIRLGITVNDQRREILDLSVTDYCSGPKKDRDEEGHVWEFGKCIAGHEVYIKLKMVDISGVGIVKCISFHEAEWPIHCPFAKKEG